MTTSGAQLWFLNTILSKRYQGFFKKWMIPGLGNKIILGQPVMPEGKEAIQDN